MNADIELSSVASLPADSSLTEAWLEKGLSLEETRQVIQDPLFLKRCLDCEEGLALILNDPLATAGLRNAIVSRDQRVLEALLECVEDLKVPGKRGRRPDPKTGKYMQERAAELRAAGSTHGQIAIKLYGRGGAEERKAVAELLRRHRNAAKRSSS